MPQETLKSGTDTSGSVLRKIKTGAAVASFAFQQSPWNEGVRAYIGGAMLSETHNFLAVGGVVGASTLAIEGLSASLIAASLRDMPEGMQRFKDWFRGRVSRKVGNSKANDTALALAVGAGAVVAKRHYQEDDRTLGDDNRTIAKAAGGIAAFSALVGGLAAGGSELAGRLGLEHESEIFVNVVSDWKTYLIALPLVQGGVFLKNKLKKENE